LGDIFREAGTKPDPVPGNQLVFLAGVKKLHAIYTGTALVNACVHRSYGLTNMNIFVKMFDDKLVIEIPGA
jgi:hypothetical protein